MLHCRECAARLPPVLNDPAVAVTITEVIAKITVFPGGRSMSMLDMMLVGGVILLAVLIVARKKTQR